MFKLSFVTDDKRHSMYKTPSSVVAHLPYLTATLRFDKRGAADVAGETRSKRPRLA